MPNCLLIIFSFCCCLFGQQTLALVHLMYLKASSWRLRLMISGYGYGFTMWVWIYGYGSTISRPFQSDEKRVPKIVTVASAADLIWSRGEKPSCFLSIPTIFNNLWHFWQFLSIWYDGELKNPDHDHLLWKIKYNQDLHNWINPPILKLNIPTNISPIFRMTCIYEPDDLTETRMELLAAVSTDSDLYLAKVASMTKFWHLGFGIWTPPPQDAWKLQEHLRRGLPRDSCWRQVSANVIFCSIIGLFFLWHARSLLFIVYKAKDKTGHTLETNGCDDCNYYIV